MFFAAVNFNAPSGYQPYPPPPLPWTAIDVMLTVFLSSILVSFFVLMGTGRFFRAYSVLCYVTLVYLFAADSHLRYLIGYETTTDGARRYSFWGDIMTQTECVVFLSLIAGLVVSLVFKKDRRWMLLSVICFVFFLRFVSWSFMLCLPSTADGLRDRIIKDALVDDLRAFARDCDRRLVNVDMTVGQELTPGQAVSWNEMEAKYRFLSWSGGALVAHHTYPSAAKEAPASSMVILAVNRASIWIRPDGASNSWTPNPGDHVARLAKDIFIVSYDY